MNEPIAIAYGPCIRCGTVFSFDPELVPSTSVHPETRCPIRPDGTPVEVGDADAVREPLCVPCAHTFREAADPAPIAELFPRARIDLIDVETALRIQAEL